MAENKTTFDSAFCMQLADCRRGTWKKRDTEEGGDHAL